jgi:hypothetical protein
MPETPKPKPKKPAPAAKKSTKMSLAKVSVAKAAVVDQPLELEELDESELDPSLTNVEAFSEGTAADEDDLIAEGDELDLAFDEESGEIMYENEEMIRLIAEQGEDELDLEAEPAQGDQALATVQGASLEDAPLLDLGVRAPRRLKRRVKKAYKRTLSPAGIRGLALLAVILVSALPIAYFSIQGTQLVGRQIAGHTDGLFVWVESTNTKVDKLF